MLFRSPLDDDRRGKQVDATAGRIHERDGAGTFGAILTAMRNDPAEDAANETAANTKAATELLVDIDRNLEGFDIGDA